MPWKIIQKSTQIDNPLFILSAEGGQLVNDFVNDLEIEVKGYWAEHADFGAPSSGDVGVEGVMFGGDLDGGKVVVD